MGKAYAGELEQLSKTYEWAKESSVDELSNFIKSSTKTPLYIIGSGGSFSATTFASLLHQHIGMIAKCLTPLEFLEFDNIDSNCSILFITASGNNTDILSSFDKAAKLKPKNLGILCSSVNNKLTKKAINVPNVFIHAIKIPTGKDGFLATNSLVATLVWLCKAYITSNSLPYEIPQFTELLFQNGIQLEFEEIINTKLTDFNNKDTIICLYDNWGKTAAIDAESKLVEAGLVNVQLADYRNFAHGRHNWIDKNRNSALIALITPHCENLATKTMSLIPDYIPKTEFSTKFDGPIATLGLLIQVFYLVKFIGNSRSIDPGRPGVAEFGRKIYHLPIPKNNSDSLSNFEKLALRRKFGHTDLSDKETKIRLEHLHKFIENISKVKFGAVVFDYDGTLCDSEHRLTHPSKEISEKLIQLLENGITVGIATGRGKSVRESLQKIIPEKYWSKVFVGYYNCSKIGELGNNEVPSKEPTDDPNLIEILELLEKQKIISKDNSVTSRLKQITLEDIKFNASELIYQIKLIDPTKLENIKIVESTHSVDLLSHNVSKLDLVNNIKKNLPNQYEILCIGDKGKFPGNDFELLSSIYSLSVDLVSTDVKSCWNLILTQKHGESATYEYMNKFNITRQYFMVEKLLERFSC